MKKAYLIFLLCFSSSLFAITWSTPTTLSNATPVSDPKIVMDNNGNSTALWVQNDFVVASSHPLGGSWSALTTLSLSGASSPHLGVASNGDIVAIWLEGGIVRAATKTPAGSWSLAAIVSLTGASAPRLSVDGAGNAVAVWVRGGVVESSTKLAGQLWSALADTLSAAGSDAPDISIGDDGTVVAIWHTVTSGAHRIVSARKTSVGGAWGSATNLFAGTATFTHHYPRINVDDAGDADAIWFRYSTSGPDFINVLVLTSSLPKSASTWSLGSPLSEFGMRDPATLSLSIKRDPVGNRIAFWGSSSTGNTFDIRAATKNYQGSWNPALKLTRNNLYALDGHLAVNALGNVVTVFSNHNSVSGLMDILSIETVVDSIVPGYWFEPRTVSSGGNNGYPRVASAFVGNTVHASTIWLHSEGGGQSIQAAIGSRAAILPPTNLAVTQNVNNLEIYQDYFNTLTWQASPSNTVSQYSIYRNEILIGQVSKSTFQFVDHNQGQNQAVTYGIVALDSIFAPSAMATVNFPP